MTVTGKNSKRRFNLFDAMILVVALVVIAAVIYVAKSGKFSPKLISDTIHVVYQVEIIDVETELKNAAQVNDTVRDGVKRVNIGKIIGVDVKPYTAQIPNYENGTMVTAVVGDKSTVVLTIEADARMSGGRLAVNGSVLGVGEKVYIQSKHFAGEGYCIGLSFDENK